MLWRVQLSSLQPCSPILLSNLSASSWVSFPSKTMQGRVVPVCIWLLHGHHSCLRAEKLSRILMRASSYFLMEKPFQVSQFEQTHSNCFLNVPWMLFFNLWWDLSPVNTNRGQDVKIYTSWIKSMFLLVSVMDKSGTYSYSFVCCWYWYLKMLHVLLIYMCVFSIILQCAVVYFWSRVHQDLRA